MINALIIEGVIFWSLTTILKFFTFTSNKKDLASNVLNAVSFQLNGRNPEYGISLMQIVSIYWLLGGFLLQILGNPEFAGLFGIIQFIVIYVLPVWIIASLTKKRNLS